MTMAAAIPPPAVFMGAALRGMSLEQSDTAHAVLHIDLAAIVANWRTLKARHPSGEVAAVVKADAYGLGARPVAAALHRRRLPPLRRGLAGGGACHPRPRARRDDCRARRTCSGHRGRLPRARSDPRAVLAGRDRPLAATAATRSFTSTPACRASGWHRRTGSSGGGPRPPGRDVASGYAMSHLVASEVPGDPINQLQRQRVAAARAMLPPWKFSLANSSGIFLGPDFGSDLARPGAALYGINPTPGQPNPMRGVVRLMRPGPDGARHPGGGDRRLQRHLESCAADTNRHRGAGLCRRLSPSLSNRASACFDGTPVPLVGRVSMDLTTFDVTDSPGRATRKLAGGSWPASVPRRPRRRGRHERV